MKKLKICFRTNGGGRRRVRYEYSKRRSRTLRPGNLVLTPDGRLVILDFGQVVEVPPGAQYAMLQAVAHAWHRDYAALCLDVQQLGFIPPGTDVSPLAKRIPALMDPWLDGGMGEGGRGERGPYEVLSARWRHYFFILFFCTLAKADEFVVFFFVFFLNIVFVNHRLTTDL